MNKNAILAFSLLVLGLLAVGIVPRIERQNRSKSVVFASEATLPVVAVTKVESAAEDGNIRLPGATEPNYVAQINSRSTGYVARRLVDIGDRVRAGQTLAFVDSPEIQQQLAQARAALAQAKASYAQSQALVSQSHALLDQSKANQAIAQTTYERWDRLVSRGVLPKQEGDERFSQLNARNAEVAASSAGITTANAAVQAQAANITAHEANVRRLEQMVSFQTIVAPFDGVVTERHVERGDLVTAGGSVPLFTVAQNNILRVKVSVPQVYASSVQEGASAKVVMRELPGQQFTGRIVRTAQALTAASRTMQVEVQLDNQAGKLMPGMYAEVELNAKRQEPVVLVPPDALMSNASGNRVVTVDANNKVRYRSVKLGRDLGTKLEIARGLSAGETVVRNPSDGLQEAQTVSVQK
ncbi:efflux RND transporter periplasmic adaptor subunit [Bryobacter aggregatus]|uniref:efflux RND transporter periplasmic adaptor subunit n=1 Tax=Bryobacter aggregatus TaxID=360054 RepID=UPI00068E7849|nr:efflux RND transporter periplasmic adaptor subunit [Bryobacter aggregatus]